MAYRHTLWFCTQSRTAKLFCNRPGEQILLRSSAHSGLSASMEIWPSPPPATPPDTDNLMLLSPGTRWLLVLCVLKALLCVLSSRGLDAVAAQASRTAVSGNSIMLANVNVDTRHSEKVPLLSRGAAILRQETG